MRLVWIDDVVRTDVVSLETLERRFRLDEVARYDRGRIILVRPVTHR